MIVFRLHVYQVPLISAKIRALCRFFEHAIVYIIISSLNVEVMAAYTKAGYLRLGSDPPENLNWNDVGLYQWHGSFYSQKVCTCIYVA